jgi:cytochrome c-type biogenesis protein
LAGTSGTQAQAALYLAVYAAGLIAPLLAVSAVAPTALRLLDRGKRYMRVLTLSSGGLLTVMGLLFITGHENVILGGTSTSATPATQTQPRLVDNKGSNPPATCSAGNATPPTTEPPSNLTSDPIAGVPTMLEFMSEGCPICQRMAPVVTEAERNCSRHGVRVQQVDVATTDGRASAGRHGVLGVPTFIFLDAQGVEVARLVGQQPRETIRQSLEVLAGQHCDGFRPLDTSPSPGT